MSFASNLKKILVGFITLAVAAGAYLFIAAPRAEALESLSTIQAGDLIRGESFSAVYYMGEDGFRYVFPNQKTYDTWYDNFDSVKFISDSDLAKIQIGGNVRYRPGVRMIKIDTDPATYAVGQDGVLRHVTTEAVATALYGSNWNQQIDDMPDGFFTNYSVGDAITDAAQFDPAAETAAVTTISINRELEAPAEISITDNGFSPIDVTIDAGGSVRFTNNGTTKHTATADDLSWGTGTLQPGGSYLQTFDEAGDYGFFDSYDSTATGAVFVE